MRTAMEYAAMRGQLDIMHLLEEQGYKMSSVKECHAVSYQAIRENHPHVLEYCLQCAYIIVGDNIVRGVGLLNWAFKHMVLKRVLS